jgi:hypothetical protein
MNFSTENDNNFGYEKITIVVDNMPLRFIKSFIETLFFRFKKADHRYWKLINYALT